MAGYIIYSLDWGKFQKFVNEPSRDQLLALAELVSDGLDEYDQKFKDDDPLADWPSEPEELCDIVKQRLAMPDWYGDLSDCGKALWERAFVVFCDGAKPKDVGFKVESDGVYWDVIEISRRHHRVSVNAVTDTIVSQFGMRPYRYHPEIGKTLGFEDWSAHHSMHTPDEVQQLLEELEAAGPDIEKSKDKEAKSDYENELMPAIEKIASSGRMLYIGVDT